MVEQLVSWEAAKLLKEKGFDIEKFGNYYISSCGKIFNQSGIEMKQDAYTKYNRIRLTIDGVKKTFSIHRLVAMLFIHNPNNLPQVNHIDGNKLNNNVSNLEWCTKSDNELHAYRTGLKRGFWKGKTGKNFPLSIPIVCRETGEVFSCTREAAEKYNITSLSGITACCKGKRETLGGVHWSYYKPNELVKLAIGKGFNRYPESFDGDSYFIYQSLAQKWLREKHNLFVHSFCNDSGWAWQIDKCDGTFIKWSDNAGWKWNTYEEALECGIIEALKLCKQINNI